MKKIKVCSSQFNYQYGSVIHFPYSIASLIAYIKSFPDLESNFQFEKSFVFRNKFEDYVSRCKGVDILLCSFNKAIWVGRNQGNYKCHPEFLQSSEI